MNHKDASNPAIRNIAIIAHVDHGKTTLVDAMFRQTGVFREGQEAPERLMDSMDLERERGITIAAKNCSVVWKGVKINILDTPGHADFGGEVERALSMVDGAMLLVDASEGPLPQTRFVLGKALELRLSVIVVINKIDRPDARPAEVLSEIYDLFIDLGADDRQLEFPLLYAIGKAGIAKESLEGEGKDLQPLLDAVLAQIPCPAFSQAEPFQMLVSDLSYSDFFGRQAIGKVVNGRAQSKDSLVCIGEDEIREALNVTKLHSYQGVKIVEADSAEPGDIVVLSGIENVHIGDTICTRDAPKALPRIIIDEPTVSMRFFVNTSPLSGMDGKNVQSVKLLERLRKETLQERLHTGGRSQVRRRLHRPGPGRVPAGHTDRDAPAGGLRALRRKAGGHLQGEGRQEAGADRAPVGRLQRSLRGHRHGQAVRAEGAHALLCRARGRARPAGVLRPDPGPDRLPRHLPDGHEGHGHHELLSLRLRGIPGRFRRPHDGLPGVRPEPGTRSPTASSTWSRAAGSSSCPGSRSTRA